VETHHRRLKRSPLVATVVLALLGFAPPRASAGFVVSLNDNWNNGGGQGGSINGTPPLLTFTDVQGGVLLTIQNNLTLNTSPSVIDTIWLNFGKDPLSASLLDNLSHLQFTAQGGTATNLLTGFATGENGEKADGTGGYYDIQLNFANQNFAGGGLTAKYLITTTSTDGQLFNADTFDNLATGATSPTPDLTASAHIIGGNKPSIYIGGYGVPTSAPAPPAMALAVSGLVSSGLVGLWRLRRSRRAA
jgi:hypothetical protein